MAITAIMKKAVVRFVNKHEYEKDGKKGTVLTYILGDVENEKANGSLICKAFADGHDQETLGVGDIVKVKGDIREIFKRDAEGNLVKTDDGKLISDHWEMIILAMGLLEKATEKTTEEKKTITTTKKSFMQNAEDLPF
jgi:hypothetical protein